ncbi:MAG: hypothetical protein AVDCRST_MAG76-3711 [uncultured Acidimicrobiales bacterium]|uniref:Uncharacterized protein n=1 Tax=uncultured Acidimicrobiales bacterium TaxID=310071 RepID=A0A6J4JCH5_9ACTN|nr:MAG: hypothetical protein AVDCRST_MAG76-3711 [uncultured Acidimicrobiales bacterium]
MVSIMESDANRQVEELQRQRLAVYCSQAGTPAWAWPAFGLGVFLFISSYELRSTWVSVIATLAYSIFVGVWARMVITRTGVQPRLRGMPKPLLVEMVRFWIAGALVAGAVVALGFAVSFVLGGAVAALVTILGGRHFDRRYRRRSRELLAGGATPSR